MRIRNVVTLGLSSLLAGPALAQIPDIAGQANAAVQATAQSDQSNIPSVQKSDANVQSSANLGSTLNTTPRAGEPNAQQSAQQNAQLNARVNGSASVGAQDVNAQGTNQAQIQADNTTRAQVRGSNQVQAGASDAQLNSNNNLNIQRNGNASNTTVNGQSNGVVNGAYDVNSSNGQFYQTNQPHQTFMLPGNSIMSSSDYYQGNVGNSAGSYVNGNMVSGMGYVPSSTYQNVQYASGTSYPTSGWSSAHYGSEGNCCCTTKRMGRRGLRLR